MGPGSLPSGDRRGSGSALCDAAYTSMTRRNYDLSSLSRVAGLSKQIPCVPAVAYLISPTSGLPELLPNRLNLDTGAVWTGRLTVAAFDPELRRPSVYQTRDREGGSHSDTEVLRIASDRIATLLGQSDEKHMVALAEALMIECAMKICDFRGYEEARNVAVHLYARLGSD